MFNVMLVEDLDEAQLVVKRALTNASIELEIKSTVKESLDFVKSEMFTKMNLILLDLSLPDGDGFTVLDSIRTSQNPQVPVFLLTSDDDLDSKVSAFNLGADDYLIKPISGTELKARVEMRIKKTVGLKTQNTRISNGGLKLDLSLMRASVEVNNASNVLPLTAKEFKILALLMQNEGVVFSRQDLVKSVWGDGIHVLERTVDSHIFGLRKKMKAFASKVECIPNVGYRYLSQSENETKKK